MEYILSSHVQASGTKIFCVSYTDARSAKGSSLNDMRLGITHHVVGSNCPHLACAKAGDIAVVTAYEENKRVVVLGMLGAALPDCTVWQDAGGERWRFNFEFKPLTGEIMLEDIKSAWTTICNEQSVNPHNMFNTRLCGHGEKYKSVLARAIEEGLILLAPTRRA